MLPGGGEFQGDHAAVARIAAPDHMTGGDQTVGEPGHRRGLEPERAGDVGRRGPPEVGQDREHPELPHGYRAVKDIDAPQCDAGEHPRGGLQHFHHLGRQFRRFRERP